MRKHILIILLFLPFLAMSQQKANYFLAARFAPKKLDKMIFSLSIDPHWLKLSNKFWYTYETSEGKQWNIVDPVKGEKKAMFNRDKIAAELTKIIKDPFDGQHLPIDSLKFIKDENWIQFEVKSTIEVNKDAVVKKDAKPEKIKKTFYFEYNLVTEQLNELVGFKKPKRKPSWANISPDEKIVVFGRNYNLFYMDKENFNKAILNDEDSTGLFASLDVVNAAGAPVSTSCGLETTAGTCVKWTVSGARELGVYTVTASADGHADTTAAVTVEDGGGGCPAYQIFTMVLIPD